MGAKKRARRPRRRRREPSLFGPLEPEGAAPDLEELIGLREFAALRGVSQREVQDAIARGKLRRSVHVRGDRRLLHRASAENEWESSPDELEPEPLDRRPVTAGEAVRASRPEGRGPTPLGIRAYARLRGLDESSVREAIALGRLRRSVHRVGRATLIDPAIAAEEWKKNTVPTFRPDPPTSDAAEERRRRELALALAEEPGASSSVLFDALEREDADDRSDQGILHERAQREKWLRRRLRLEVLAMRRNLIEADEVERRAEACADVVRSVCSRLPTTLAHQLAPKLTPADVGRILEAAIAEALQEIGRRLTARSPRSAAAIPASGPGPRRPRAGGAA